MIENFIFIISFSNATIVNLFNEKGKKVVMKVIIISPTLFTLKSFSDIVIRVLK